MRIKLTVFFFSGMVMLADGVYNRRLRPKCVQQAPAVSKTIRDGYVGRLVSGKRRWNGGGYRAGSLTLCYINGADKVAGVELMEIETHRHAVYLGPIPR